MSTDRLKQSTTKRDSSDSASTVQFVPPTGDVEEQKWYHGMRPRRDIEHLLIQDGDFLVRASDGRTNKVEIILSIKSSTKGLVHLTLANVDGQWQLGITSRIKKMIRFPTIAALIEHYKKYKISNSMVLKRGVHRPDWLIKHEKVTFDITKDHLGSGNFCSVYKGKYDKGDDQIVDVAVKICHSYTGENADEKSSEEVRTAREMMLSEAKTMSHFVHSCVIQLYGVACDHPPILIVMEFCPGGSLDKYLQKQKDDIDDGERLCYIMEAAKGMKYLHLRNCVHRDLAARNCLISSHGTIKISDFGLSKLIDGDKADETIDEESPQIPLRWMAPESLKKPQKYSKNSDVWSFGVLVYEIFNNGEKPWPDWPPKKIATHIRKGSMPSLPAKTPNELKILVGKMWQLTANDRPSFREICQKLLKMFKKCPPPKPSKFSLNKLPGVEKSSVMRDTIDDDDDKTDNTTTNRDSIETQSLTRKSKSEDDCKNSASK